MPRQKLEDHAAREQQILDAAAEVMIHYGYDKTTMGDIAEHAGVTRAIVYLHFDSKELLFEALLYRETQKYLQNWLESFQTATQSGPAARVFACIFGSALYAVRRSPLLSALMKQDRHVFGKYLRKPGRFLASVQNRSVWPQMLKELQNVGAIRKNIEPAAMGHLVNALAIGIMALEEEKPGSETPSFDAILETTADMLDRALAPEDGGNTAAGQAVIQQFALAAQSQLELGKREHPSSEKPKL